MAEPRLPSGFADPEPFVDRWCLAIERERYAQRRASAMEEMRAFYDAMFPRVGAVEVWGQPNIIDTGGAYHDRVIEPIP